MKISEFKRWLELQGVVVKQGARLWKLYGPRGQSTLPRHPSKEIKEGLRRAILKQLGL
ncbi:MAG: type II toxin-antitoxin system HicA family toxin [Ottowia sp.]|nr:type II toxin-antitoxin system HicA family toxin [Ottowia sp.]